MRQATALTHVVTRDAPGPCGSVLGTVGPGFGHGGGRESGVTSWSRLSISQKKEEGCHGD